MTDRAEEIRSLLRRREAASIEHPGGTLADHLERVRERLAGLGAREDLQLAGLGHAVYGTDGFAVALLSVAHREAVRDMLGPEVELIIYRYGAADRKKTWSGLAATGQVWDRFEGSVETLGPHELRDFVDLSIVNEIDVLAHSPELARTHGGRLAGVIAGWRPLASPAVLEDADRILAPLLRG
jgi:hypothetical protein